jgi:hypothetical protein
MIDLTSFIVPSYDRYGNLTDLKSIRVKEIPSWLFLSCFVGGYAQVMGNRKLGAGTSLMVDTKDEPEVLRGAVSRVLRRWSRARIDCNEIASVHPHRDV